MTTAEMLAILQNSAIGDFLSEVIREAGRAFIKARFSGLGLNVKTLISMSLYLSLIIYGIKFIAGDLAASGKSAAITCIWVVLGLQITSYSFYSNYIYDTIFIVKDNLAGYLMAGTGGWSLYQSFSIANNRMFEHAYLLVKAASWSDWWPLLSGGIISIVYGLYYIIFIAITIYAELGIIILLLLGSIVIPISGFQSMRGLFKSWMVALIKYIAIFVIIAVVVSLLNKISSLAVNGLMEVSYGNGVISEDNVAEEGGVSRMLTGLVLIIGCLGIFLLLQTLEFASELTGGVMSGTSGAGAMRGTASAVGAGGGVVKKYGGGALGKKAADGIKSIGGKAWNAARGK